MEEARLHVYYARCMLSLRLFATMHFLLPNCRSVFHRLGGTSILIQDAAQV